MPYWIPIPNGVFMVSMRLHNWRAVNHSLAIVKVFPFWDAILLQ